MIAHVTTCVKDGDAVLVTVSYRDNSDPANIKELATNQFRFGPSITTQQAKADIQAWGKALDERTRETTRLMNALEPGTELSV